MCAVFNIGDTKVMGRLDIHNRNIERHFVKLSSKRMEMVVVHNIFYRRDRNIK